VLERARYHVLTTEDGPSGLSLFRKQAKDGVVLDYYMPGPDGGVVAETMRRERPSVPIMLLRDGVLSAALRPIPLPLVGVRAG
jgi:CheY-like chemotaxis protein